MMFKKARIKLTALYLLIIMFVSLSFSTIIYHQFDNEFQRRLHIIEKRFGQQEGLFRPSGFPNRQFRILPEDIEAIRSQLLKILAYTNTAIFIFSASAGYFLAGRTLKPIEEALNEQKRFVADASHELKTPLTALITTLEVALDRKKLDIKRAKDAIVNSLEEALGLKRLTNDLLLLAKNQENGSSLYEKININGLLNKITKRFMPIAKKKKIDFKTKSQRIMLTASKDGMEKLLTILIDNAIKYTNEKGRVSVEVFKLKNSMKIVVKDTGIGIASRDLPHIWDRFYRVEKSRSKKITEGYGLGLAIAKKIVEQHAGSIRAESEINKGSSFIVRLPL
jgi:two-component system, OmpR family, sensor histidine kinase CiaH